MNFIGLDLSTKTGFVVLDDDGSVLRAEEIHLKYDTTEHMCNAIDEIMFHVREEGGFLAVEGFSYGSKGKAVDKQYGIGWLLRAELFKSTYEHIIVPPSTLKNFAGAKGNCKKDALAVEIFKRWAYEHSSDNVRDAFVLAQIARGIHHSSSLTKFQQDAIKKVSR